MRDPAGTDDRLRRGLIAMAMALAYTAAGGEPALAQDEGPERYTLVFRGVAMDRALEEFARLAPIDLVYSSDLAANKYVYCDGRGLSTESLLKCILSESGLDYVRSSSGTYVLIEALRAPPRRGHLGGRVVDAATGEPLPFANVLLADASTGTTTDAAGLFSFSSLVSGPHRIVATYVGYETATDEIVVTPGDRNRVEIPLTPEPVVMGPIVISGLTQRLSSRDLGSGSATQADIAAQGAIGTADVTRAAGDLAGVAVHHPMADLHIQGAAGGDHLTVLDGVPVRDPVTLGRHLGAFSPLAIDRITVHKAGFGAALGSHLSGVVSLDHDVSDRADRAAAFSIDPLSLNGRVQATIPLPKGAVAGGMLAARTSLWNVFRDPGLENLLNHWNSVDPILAGIWIDEEVNTSSLISSRHVPDLAFSDLHAAGRVNLSPFHSLHASAYRARNHIASELAAVNSDNASDPDRLVLTRDDYDWTNWIAQVRHAWLGGARSVVTTQIRAGSHTSQYRYLSLHEGLPFGAAAADVEQATADLRRRLGNGVGSDEENRIREIAVKVALNRSLSPRQHVEIALEAERINSRFMLGNQFVRPFMHESNVWELAGYVENRLSLGLRTSIDPGLRLTYLPARGTLYAEPRLSARYDGDAGRLGPYAVRLAGGMYRQFTPSLSLTSSGSTSVVPFVRFWLPVDRSVAPPRSYHLALETLFMPGRSWQLAFEAYRKWQPRVLVVDYQTLLTDFPSVRPRPDPIALPQATFVHAVRGRAWGGIARATLDTGSLSTMLQYSYSRSEQLDSDRFGGTWQPVAWDQPHRLQLRFRMPITSALTIHANVEGVWGRPWAFRRAYYDYLAFRPDPPSIAPFDLDDPSTPRRPVSFRVDPGITYDWSWDRLRVEARAVVVNAFDRNDVFDWSLERSGDEYVRVARALPGRRPVFSLSVSY